MYGTRPEFTKIRPLLNKFKGVIPYKVLFTGQHIDIVPKNADFNISILPTESNRLDAVIKSCLDLPDKIFENISHILVQGDTSSVLGMALTAFNRQIKKSWFKNL